MMTPHLNARLSLSLMFALVLSQPACSDTASTGPIDDQDSVSQTTASEGPAEADSSESPSGNDTSSSAGDASIDAVIQPSADADATSDPVEDAGPITEDISPPDDVEADSQIEPDTSTEDAAAGDTSTSDAAQLGDAGPPEADAEEDIQTSEPDTAANDTWVGPDAEDATETEDTTEALGDATADADITTEPAPEIPPTVAFNAPAAMASFDEGLPITFNALVTAGDAALETLSWTLTSSADGLMGAGSVSPEGVVEFVTSTLSPGPHIVTLNIDTPTLPQAAEATVTLKICAVMTPDDFDADIEAAGWKLYGNAYWDEGGWLELTGLDSGGGSIYKVSETLSASDTTILFDFYTGDGINGGADGFAMTVVDVDSITELETYIDTAKFGGCLGYGASGACGPMEIEAFHVEIDTWKNTNYSDPLTNHIAVTLNGDPANHVLVADGLILEDSLWHTIEIVVTGTNVAVNLDGINLINGDIPGLSFRGGYIGFSGSIGWATNWHRVDNLTVVQECSAL